MRIKKFISKTLKEGKALVLRELGDEAVVLSSRTGKNPDTGEEYVEIVAALDDGLNKKSKFKFPGLEENSREESPTPHNDQAILSSTGKIIEEIGVIKDVLAGISESIKYKYSASLSPVTSMLYKAMRKEGFSDEVALEISGKALNGGRNLDFHAALEEAKELLLEKLRFTDPLKKFSGPRVVVFVGPTGCGKTTTLIKVAVVCKLLLKSNILILSADTYKVGGADQLQNIASIASIPFQAVYSADEVTSVLQEEKKKDFIFIDTTGRSQNNPSHLDEIKDIVAASKADYVYLTINAASSKSNILQVIDKFSDFNLSGAAITKLDETANLGDLIEALSERKLPIAYMAAGQATPEDIEPGNAETLKSLLFKNEYQGEGQV